MKLYGYFLLLISAVCYAASPNDEIIEAAKPLHALQIVYPPKAERHEEEGTVVLKMRVLADGSTNEIVIFKSSGYPLLDSSALESAMGMRFSPAKNRLGMPIDSSVFIPILYKLLPGKSK
jgi:TonB family protein